MARPSVSPEQRAEMRQRIQNAVAAIGKRRNIAPGDVRSWDEVTIRDVTDEADISVGTFYKYFNNRAELRQSLWAEPVDKLKTLMSAGVAATDDPQKKVRILLEHYVQFSVDSPRVFRGAFLFVRPDGDPKPELQSLEQEMFFQSLCAAFSEGQEKGIFAAFNVTEMAQVFWAAIHGAVALPINVDRYDFGEPSSLPESMINTLLRMISKKE